MSVCLYIIIYVYVYIYIYIYIYIYSVFPDIYIHIGVCTYEVIYIYIYIHRNECVYRSEFIFLSFGYQRERKWDSTQTSKIADIARSQVSSVLVPVLVWPGSLDVSFFFPSFCPVLSSLIFPLSCLPTYRNDFFSQRNLRRHSFLFPAVLLRESYSKKGASSQTFILPQPQTPFKPPIYMCLI